MAFDTSNYQVAKPKALPVILLLDVSGSMSGQKITALHNSVVEMVNTFVQERAKETIIKVAMITFGASVSLHTPYTDAEELQQKGISNFFAVGMTPLGAALHMAKDMVDDKEETPPRELWAPITVLVSDGCPNDNWQGYFNAYINGDANGNFSTKGQRFSVAIGNDADMDMLRSFAGNGGECFIAEDATKLVETFKKISKTISETSSQVGKDGTGGGTSGIGPSITRPVGPSQTSGGGGSVGRPKSIVKPSNPGNNTDEDEEW